MRLSGWYIPETALDRHVRADERGVLRCVLLAGRVEGALRYWRWEARDEDGELLRWGETLVLDEARELAIRAVNLSVELPPNTEDWSYEREGRSYRMYVTADDQERLIAEVKLGEGARWRWRALDPMDGFQSCRGGEVADRTTACWNADVVLLRYPLPESQELPGEEMTERVLRERLGQASARLAQALEEP